MAEIEYPGVVQLIERVVWDHEAASLSLATRTKIPLKSLISEGFSYSLSIAAQNLRCGFDKLEVAVVKVMLILRYYSSELRHSFFSLCVSIQNIERAK